MNSPPRLLPRSNLRWRLLDARAHTALGPVPASSRHPPRLQSSVRSLRRALRLPERLEDRRLLSLAPVDFGQPDANWFADVASPFGPLSLEERAVATVRDSSGAEAIDQVAASRWIVQLDETAVSELSTLDAAGPLLSGDRRGSRWCAAWGCPASCWSVRSVAVRKWRPRSEAHPSVNWFERDELISG